MFRRYHKDWDLIAKQCAVLAFSLELRQRVRCQVLHARAVCTVEFKFRPSQPRAHFFASSLGDERDP